MATNKIKFIQDNRIAPLSEWKKYLGDNRWDKDTPLFDEDHWLGYLGQVNSHPVVERANCYEKKDLYSLHFWLPLRYINTSSLFIGSMGYGKSNLLKHLVALLTFKNNNINFAGFNGLIHDVKGEYVESFYDPETDIILNHLDERSVVWDILGEFKTNRLIMKPVLVSMINGYNKSEGGNGAFWTEVGSGWLVRFFEACLEEEIPPAVMPEVIDEKWAQYMIEAGNDSTQKSALATIKPVLEAIRRVYWIARQSDKRLITTADIMPPSSDKENTIKTAKRTFLVTLKEYEEEMKIINSGLMTCLFKKFLSRPDVKSPNDYYLFFLDEYLSFAIDPDVENAITTLARSKGMCLFLAMQYLPEDKKRLASLTNTRFLTIVFRIGVQSTAKHFEDMQGEIIYEEQKENVSVSEKNTTKSKNWVRHTIKALPHELLLNLPRGTAFMQVAAGDRQLSSFINLPGFEAKKLYPGFIMDNNALNSPSVIAN